MASTPRTQQPVRKEPWTERERHRLWQLREENPQIKWSQFRHRFFPHRTAAALMTHYSYMKTDRERNHSKRAEDAKQGDNLQSNKRQLSSRGTADRPPSKRRKSTSREPNDDDDLSSVEDSESESESETDSEAGDIPYENGSPKRLSQTIRQSSSGLNANRENLRSSLLAKKKAQRPDASTNDNEDGQEESTQNTTRSIKVQSPSDSGARAGLPSSIPQSTQASQVYLSPVESPETSATTLQPATATQYATSAVPVFSGEQYTSLFQTFQQTATVLAHYPQVVARADEAERENAEKQRAIQQMQQMQVSHETEISELRDRLASQNASMQEQQATISDLQAQIQAVENQQRMKIVEQSERLNGTEHSVAEQTHAEASEHDKTKDAEQAPCVECPALRQENDRLTEEMANIRDLLNRMIPTRVPRSPPTATGVGAEAREPGSAP